MNEPSSESIAEQLLADLRQEQQLVNSIIRGCIEHRWALGEEETELTEAMIYNAFEAYAIARGMALSEAERFCEQHLDELIERVQAIL
ncbi:hypothetical protein H6F98_03475 [Microcoleus sp. FACHB-SPT15]|uniref:hypothetical protein n=1 Tax=Microcoleus sp. FACHB-SPT15 TaxID=2692830 RepID=UPI00177C2E2A|nr:hypothetical protein [Microcoleus sp. FACHB-SPT15]MBD1804534.1 hypothetical protein [Microcoleus sp. FACHB-SPT15]